MFEESQLDEALETQSKAYKLLRWVSEGIQKGFIRFERAHQWTTASSAASAWLRGHFENVPPDCRPAKADGPEFDRFVNYFASYLLTSFDVHPDPGIELGSRCGCYCPICTYLVAGKHLKPKKLCSADKHTAENLKRQYLEQLAIDNGINVLDAQLDGILINDALSRAAALLRLSVRGAAPLFGSALGTGIPCAVATICLEFEGISNKGLQVEVQRRTVGAGRIAGRSQGASGLRSQSRRG